MEEKNTAQAERKYGLQIDFRKMWPMGLLFVAMLLIVGVLTLVLPQGEYEREVIDGSEYIVEGTYRLLEEENRLPVWRWFTAPVEVLFSEDGGTVYFVVALSIFIGGIYYVLDKSDLLKRFVCFLYRRFNTRRYLMMCIVLVVFLLLSSALGVTDEVLGFIPLMILLSISFGWDSFVGVAMSYLVVCRGYAASTLNPYGVALAQGIAGVPLYSGLWIRFLYLAVTGGIFMAFVLIYAKRVEKNPKLSLNYDADERWRSQYTGGALFNYEKKRYPFFEIVKDFGRGALSMLPTSIIACIIMGVQFLIKEGEILDTIIHFLAGLTAGASSFGAAMIMMGFVMVIEIFLPGTLVKAITILPIIVPVGELSGISRQATCFIFAIGDAYPNLIYPTDAMLIMTLAMLGTSYRKWIKWLWPYVAVCLVISIAFVALALVSGL